MKTSKWFIVEIGDSYIGFACKFDDGSYGAISLTQWIPMLFVEYKEARAAAKSWNAKHDTKATVKTLVESKG